MKKFVWGWIVAEIVLLMVACDCRTSITDDAKVAYLAVYMKGDDEHHLYYAMADSGFLFRPLNQGNPVLSASFDDRLIRDPMVLKDKNGIYHLVATVSWQNRPFTVWDSRDLVHWENERLVDVAPEGATKTWAPEFAYDEENDSYMVFWTAELNNDWNTASIYYATTTDFVHYSKTEILYTLNGTGILDANILKVNGVYHLIYRNNGIWVATSKSIRGPYTEPYLLTPENVEGPFAFPLNDGDGYGVVWDYFGRSAGFGLWTSSDFVDWKRVTNERAPFYNDRVSFPIGIRHGAILGITEEEKKVLLENFD